MIGNEIKESKVALYSTTHIGRGAVRYRRRFVRIRCISFQSNSVFQYLKGVEWERRGLYNVLVGKSGRKRTLRRPRNRWDDNIKM